MQTESRLTPDDLEKINELKKKFSVQGDAKEYERGICLDAQFCANFERGRCPMQRMAECFPIAKDNHESVIIAAESILYVCSLSMMAEKGLFHFKDPPVKILEVIYLSSRERGGKAMTSMARQEEIYDAAVQSHYERRKISLASKESEINNSLFGQSLTTQPL